MSLARLLASAAAFAVLARPAAARPAFDAVMPWHCLERCGDAARDIAFGFWQHAVNRSVLTHASFEAHDLTQDGGVRRSPNVTAVGPTGVFPLVGARAVSMISSFPYPAWILSAMRLAFARAGAFAADLVAIAEADGLQGFDFDIEPADTAGFPQPTPADAAAYVAFLNTVADALHARGLTVGVCVATWSKIWDLQALGASRVDYVKTMQTYTGSDAEFAAALAQAVADVPLGKLVVGLESTNDDDGGRPFNATAVALRFDAIKRAGVRMVGIWRAPVPDLFWAHLVE